VLPLPVLEVEVVVVAVVDEAIDAVVLELVVSKEELVVELVEYTVVEFDDEALEDVVVDVVDVVGIGATYELK
jgi:hypothetical protein